MAGISSGQALELAFWVAREIFPMIFSAEIGSSKRWPFKGLRSDLAASKEPENVVSFDAVVGSIVTWVVGFLMGQGAGFCVAGVGAALSWTAALVGLAVLTGWAMDVMEEAVAGCAAGGSTSIAELVAWPFS